MRPRAGYAALDAEDLHRHASPHMRSIVLVCLLASWLPAATAYDRVVNIGWDFLMRLPNLPNGLPAYYTNCCLDEKHVEKDFFWPHQPAAFGAQLVDSAAATYAYNGDHKVIEIARGFLDHVLGHGTTPKEWTWGGVPYASSDHSAINFRGAHDLPPCNVPTCWHAKFNPVTPIIHLSRFAPMRRLTWFMRNTLRAFWARSNC